MHQQWKPHTTSRNPGSAGRFALYSTAFNSSDPRLTAGHAEVDPWCAHHTGPCLLTTHRHSGSRKLTSSSIFLWWSLQCVPAILTNFYRCTTESSLTGGITVWCRNWSAHSRRSLQRAVEAAQRITGNRLLAIQEIFSSAVTAEKNAQHHRGPQPPSSQTCYCLVDDAGACLHAPADFRRVFLFPHQAFRLFNS